MEDDPHKKKAMEGRLALAVRIRDEICACFGLTLQDLMSKETGSDLRRPEARRLVALSIAQVLGRDDAWIGSFINRTADEVALIFSLPPTSHPVSIAIRARRMFRIEGKDTYEIGRLLRINEANADRYLHVGADLERGRLTFHQAMEKLRRPVRASDGSSQGSSPA